MSLQVWLPLNGNLNNQGLSNSVAINSGATVDNSGKIGKCYSLVSGNYIGIDSANVNKHKYQNFTLALWVYLTQSDATERYILGCWESGGCGFCWQNQKVNFCLYSGGYKYAWSNVVSLNTWHHIVGTFDGKDEKLYIDGTLQATTAVNGQITYQATTPWEIGGNPGPSYFDSGNLNGKVNDIRIYDHCLSEKEVKELSKGLVLHYKLNDSAVSANLLKDTTNFSLSGSDYSATSTRTLGKITVISDSYFNAYQWVQSYFGPNSASIVNNTKTYTLSVDILANGVSATAKPTFSIDFRRDDHSQLVSGTIYLDPKYNGIWHRYSIPITGSGQNQTRSLIGTSGTNCNGVTIEYKNFKFEEGNNPNGLWTPYYNGGPIVNLTAYDSSGYGNNGTINTSNIQLAKNSPRYDKCTKFTDCSNGGILSNLPCPLNNTFTVTCYVKYNAVIADQWLYSMSDSSSHISCNGGLNGGAQWQALRFTPTSYKGFQGGTPTTNWTMFTAVYDTNGCNLYLNGEFIGQTASSSYSSSITTNKLTLAALDNVAYLSDFRIYATALSADDIKELYQTSASVDKNGNFYAWEFVES